ncbi:MAG TPA: hypothetical protein VKU41_27400 [Polyangiaceae bacterium]|nr:hypothetical protein [Polyangiaceae bacterium]
MAAKPEARSVAWLVALAMAGLLAHALYLAVPVVDDAAISLDYGLTLFEGHGLRLNPASQVVEGFSSPLWTFALGLGASVGRDPERVAQGMGMAFAILALPVFASWGAAARGHARVEDAAGALVVAPMTTYAYWGSSGMETGLQSLLMGVGGALVLLELRRGSPQARAKREFGRRTRRGALAGVALGLLCLVRPEGLLYAVAAGSLWASCLARDRRRPGTQEVAIALTCLGIAGAYVAFRRLYFDAWLPNTYYVKAGADFQVRAYLARFFQRHTAIVVSGALGAIAAFAIGNADHRHGRLGAAFAAAGLFFVVRFKGDWMREWRLLAPLVPCSGVALAAGVGAVRDRMNRWGPRAARAAPYAVAGAMATSLGAEAIFDLPRSAWLRTQPELPSAAVAEQARRIDLDLRAMGVRRPRLAFPDIGGLGLALRGAEVIDTGRLADDALTRHTGHAAATVDYLRSEGLPDALDVHGPSTEIAGLEQILAFYEPLKRLPGDEHASESLYVFVGLTATEDPRCPGGRRDVVALSAAQLATRMQVMLDQGDAEIALLLWRCARAYQPPSLLPDRAWQRRTAERAAAASDRADRAGHSLLALRLASVASVLSDDDPRRRHRAEALRERVFADTLR